MTPSSLYCQLGNFVIVLLLLKPTNAGLEYIIRADLPVTKTDRKISNIYCNNNPKAIEFKGYERLIRQVDPDAFVNCTELVTVNLNTNIIKKLHKNTFRNNVKIESLGLSNNWLETIHRKIFEKLTELQMLELYENYLHYLHKDTFKHNIQLQTLLLYGNKLEFIHEETFVNLINLRVLHLDNNRLKSLSPDLFKNLASLEELFFYTNALSSLNEAPIIRYLPKLTAINFNNNDLSCGEVKRILDTLSRKTGLTVYSFKWSNPRRIDATDNIQGDYFCVPQQQWNQRKDDYRRRVDRAGILYDLQMSLDEQRDAIDDLRSNFELLQSEVKELRDDGKKTDAMVTPTKELESLRLEVNELKIAKLELMHLNKKYEEELNVLRGGEGTKLERVNHFEEIQLYCKIDSAPKYNSYVIEEQKDIDREDNNEEEVEIIKDKAKPVKSD